MTTPFTTRNKPTTPFSIREKTLGNDYFLQDALGNFLTDVNGNFFIVGGGAYEVSTPYSLRIKP